MAKIARKTQLIFGSSAAAGQIAEFGSLAAGTPTFTTDPAIIQSLANYLQGWYGAVVGPNSPAIEDMNALCYLYAYQLAYVMQEGVSEWDSGTTYFIGSIVNDGLGNLYKSLTDNNLNNALSSSSNWQNISGGTNLVAFNPSTQSPYTMTSADNNKTFLVNSLNGASTFNLPSPSPNFSFRVKDVGFNFNTNGVTFHRFGSELFELIAADYTFNASGGEQQISSDGTNWYITAR